MSHLAAPQEVVAQKGRAGALRKRLHAGVARTCGGSLNRQSIRLRGEKKSPNRLKNQPIRAFVAQHPRWQHWQPVL
ncbi:hypothetical protein [Comamonas composti]|uniref:hypothetical protein n=1 Tax=Comamonas composti TaxID=408558 RepID=UPI000413384E|nr:hypothetical protein [Comamonas composti]